MSHPEKKLHVHLACLAIHEGFLLGPPKNTLDGDR